VCLLFFLSIFYVRACVWAGAHVWVWAGGSVWVFWRGELIFELFVYASTRTLTSKHT